MAYVKFDKELAQSAVDNLTNIRKDIDSTLNDISKSFANNKVNLSSRFLKIFDEENELIADFTSNARTYNNEADSGANKAGDISRDVTSRISKVISALKKVMKLIEQFENQNDVSIESEAGNSNGVFSFLDKYGTASTLSSLKGDGLFGDYLLDDFNSLYTNRNNSYNNLNIWKRLSNLSNRDSKEENATVSELMTYFFDRLSDRIDESGNVIVDGMNVGDLSAIQLSLLFSTPFGQLLKNECEEKFKNDIFSFSSKLFGDDILPFQEESKYGDILGDKEDGKEWFDNSFDKIEDSILSLSGVVAGATKLVLDKNTDKKDVESGHDVEKGKFDIG